MVTHPPALLPTYSEVTASQVVGYILYSNTYTHFRCRREFINAENMRFLPSFTFSSSPSFFSVTMKAMR